MNSLQPRWHRCVLSPVLFMLLLTDTGRVLRDVGTDAAVPAGEIYSKAVKPPATRLKRLAYTLALLFLKLSSTSVALLLFSESTYQFFP